MNDHPTGYHYSAKFPRETFVQKAIESHFRLGGFQFEKQGFADLACRNDKLGEHWIIEAKGVTSDVGLDFKTGLGQLLQHVDNPSTLYGVAVPETDAFLKQCRSISEWVRQTLNLYWLFVRPDGSIRIVSPEEIV